MAELVSCATGNLTAAATWALVDTTSRNTGGNDAAIGTSYSSSGTFTPGVITIDEIVLKLSSRVASPTGTFTVKLYNNTDTADVAGTTVTVNVSDLPNDQSAGNGGHIGFKFGAPVTLTAGKAYLIKVVCSVNGEVTLLASSGFDFNRMLRTTTTQAPAAGDVMYALGEYTGAGTSNSFTITMDSTATTDYGTGTDGSEALTVSSKSTVDYGVTAATNYYLKLSGNAVIYNGGTLTIGTVANPIPRDSTAVLEFDPVADGGMGLIVRNGGTFTSQGLSRTSGKDIYVCKLNQDLGGGGTTLNVDTDTGWLNGDVIGIAATLRATGGRTDAGTLNANAGATSMTISAGVSYAHSGTTLTQAHVINLTRNVKFRSATSTLMTYANFKSAATVDIDWTEFQYIGENATGKRGLEVETITGSCSIQYSSFRSCEDQIFFTVGATATNITFSNNVGYGLNTAKTNSLSGFFITATSGTITLSNNYFIQTNTSGGNVVWASLNSGAVVNTFVVSGNASGNAVGTSGGILNWTNIEVYCTDSSAGYYLSGSVLGTITGCKAWFCQQAGFLFNNANIGFVVNTLTAYGNANMNIYYGGSGNVTFNNAQISSFTGNTTQDAIRFPTANSGKLIFNNCNLDYASGSLIAHSNSVYFQVANNSNDVLFNNCLFGAAVLVNSYTNLSPTGIVKFHKHNQTANKHLWYTQYGIAQSTGTGLTDTTVRTSGSLGVRIAPVETTTGFSWSFKILAKASTYVGVAGFIKKNAAFGTDTCTVSLFLPGSTVADATQTMGNDTNWNVFNLAASYTGTEDLYATVTINAKTATAAAYIYVDDIYNGTNKITALDVWDEGQPSPIMFEQLGDAAAVWAVLQSTQTTSGTMGNRLAKALTLPLFLGLK